MKFSIKNMSVKAKIVMFSAVMLIFMVVIAGVGLFASNTINKERAARYNNYAMGEYYLSEAYSNFADIKQRIRGMAMMYYAPTVDIEFDKQIQSMDEYEASMTSNLDKFEKLIKNYDDESIEKNFQLLRSSLEKWTANNDENANRFKQGKTSTNAADYDEALILEACDNVMNVGRDIASTASGYLDEIIAALEAESADNGKKVEKELTTMTAILIVVAVIAFIITFAYAALLIKLITVPVNMISGAANKMAVGDVDVSLNKLSDDDLGVLTTNFEEMAAAIKSQVEIANELASGDMTVQVTPRSEKDVLGKALKKLAEDQNRTLSNVKESTMQVTVGAEQVAMASQSLAQGATEQASALEQVTVSVNDIAQRTKVNAAEANKANDLVHNVKKMAGSGNEQMKALKEAMVEINKTSENISKIIKIIDDISFQTNILALNAAVEAARAGVHGKGFSVVAEEVRSLAGKSASAAGETAEMIENAIRKIKTGSELADETEKSLDEISISIDEIVTLISSIAEASNSQATAVSQIDQAIGQVSQVVQTNSATSEQCAAASEELSNQAANLRKMMASFKLSGGKAGAVGGDTDLGFGASYGSDPVISLDGGEFGKY